MTYEIALLGKGTGKDLDIPRAQAFLYAGNWVVSCVDITCLAVNLAEDQWSFGASQRLKVDCPDCGATAHIVWPDPGTFAEINRLMSLRPFKGSRNWAPPWHRQSILCGLPEGQTVDQLAQENLDHGLRI